MKGILTRLGLSTLLLFVIVSVIVYVGAYRHNYETKISDEEITISRVGINPFDHTEYYINLKTGREEINHYAAPTGKNRFIDYEHGCRCITWVHVIGDYWVYTLPDRLAGYTSGEDIGEKEIVPYAEVSHIFEDALVIRNKFRDKYADIISPKTSITNP